MLSQLMRTIGFGLEISRQICLLRRQVGHNLYLVAAKVYNWLLISEAHISSLFIVKLHFNIWMDFTNTTMHQVISHKPDQVLSKVTEGKRGTCSNLWIMVAIFLRGISTCRILGQQLLKNGGPNVLGFARVHNFWNVSQSFSHWCAIGYLVNVVFLDASFRHNNTLCQLLQFQVMEKRELMMNIFMISTIYIHYKLYSSIFY